MKAAAWRTERVAAVDVFEQVATVVEDAILQAAGMYTGRVALFREREGENDMDWRCFQVCGVRRSSISRSRSRK